MVAFLVPLAVLVAANLSVAALERMPALQFRRARFRRPHLLTDSAWFVVAMSAAALSAVVFRPQFERLTITPLAERLASLPIAARFVVAVLVYDFVAFAVHVSIHRSNLLWRVHKVHHSSLHLDWLATTRTHAVEHLLRNVPAQLALFSIGASGRLVALTLLTYALFALVGHSNLDLPLRRIESVFITPRLHRLHHVTTTGQRNFGTIFSVWDRLLGSLVRCDTRPDAVLGVPGEVHNYPQRFLLAVREPFRPAAQSAATMVASVKIGT